MRKNNKNQEQKTRIPVFFTAATEALMRGRTGGGGNGGGGRGRKETPTNQPHRGEGARATATAGHGERAGDGGCPENREKGRERKGGREGGMARHYSQREDTDEGKGEKSSPSRS